MLLLLLSGVIANAQVVINEICPANADINYDPRFYNFSGWVELYNNGNSSVNVGGYYLSDKTDQRNKWRIPSATIAAKGYLLIWCDDTNTGFHTNFSLDSEGEDVILSNSSLTIIDQLNFPVQYTNISYGRIANGTPVGYLINPTPGQVNTDKTATQRLENPVFSLKSGRYSGTQVLTMSHPRSGIDIRFTTDGSEPTEASTRYTASLSIPQTQTVKAKAFYAGYLPSKSEVRTYFIGEHAFTLPVISLSTKPAYMNDNTIGIYVAGTNGKPGGCNSALRNWNQDWDRHAVMEYFEPDGNKIFDQGVDIRVAGNCSRDNTLKSLAIKARDKYGKNTIDDYQFFETKDLDSFGGFMLRSGGNDFYYAQFRDELMQSLPIGQMDIDYMANQPTAVYINGDYWGILNLREKIDGDYVESNYGIDKDDVDLIETYGNAIEGTSDAYWSYMNGLQQQNLSDPSSFSYIDEHIDVQEYINYLVAEIYYCNTDWPGNNQKFWRQRSTNGKFRWILWDTDFGFGLYSNQSWATHPTLEFATDPDNTGWPNPAESTLHIRLLLQNPIFRNRFIQTFATAMGTTFNPARVNTMINSFQDRVKTEMPYHVTRWNLNLNNWNNEVQRLRDFAVQRNIYMQGHLASFFGLGDMVSLKVTGTPLEASAFSINGVTTEGASETTYFSGLSYEVKAQPKPGYAFKEWRIIKRETTPVSLITRNTSWKFFDQGTLPAADWMSETYTDNTWPAGNGEFGYGDGDEQTVVSFGPNANNKFITTYFRKTISVADTVDFGNLTGNVIFDDGVIIYLNGMEVYRGNMPAGVVNANTLSLQNTPAEGADNGFVIPKGVIKPGVNVVAVEVHQNSVNSSDLSFDLELRTVKTGNEVELSSNEISITDVANTSVEMIAEFEVAEPVQDIVINEFSASNNSLEDEFGDKDDWIELFNKGSQPVDLAGLFITDKLNNKLKHQITSGTGDETMLEPGAYKIIWADEQTYQGPLHVNFKLSADGESIGLYQQVGDVINTLDEVTFETMGNTVSGSRIPNATGPFVLTSKVTPGAANQMEIPTDAEEDLANQIVLYPNPSNDNVFIETDLFIDSISLYDSRGGLVRQFQSVDKELATHDVHAGLYVVVIQTRSGMVSKRFVKR